LDERRFPPSAGSAVVHDDARIFFVIGNHWRPDDASLSPILLATCICLRNRFQRRERLARFPRAARQD